MHRWKENLSHHTNVWQPRQHMKMCFAVRAGKGCQSHHLLNCSRILGTDSQMCLDTKFRYAFLPSCPTFLTYHVAKSSKTLDRYLHLHWTVQYLLHLTVPSVKIKLRASSLLCCGAFTPSLFLPPNTVDLTRVHCRSRLVQISHTFSWKICMWERMTNTHISP